MRTFATVLLAVTVPTAWGADFRTIGENAAVMYDAPSRASTPVFLASRYYPVEVIVNLDAWVKVRDHTGTLSWIEKKALLERRMVIVTAPSADVRTKPEEGAPVAFQVTQNVALDLIEIAPGGWVRVKHSDGSSGYVKTSQVWGV